MAEKLYKCHCRVSSHGILYEVAKDKKKGKRELSKLRRRLYKKEIRSLYSLFNPYDLDEVAQVDSIVNGRRI